MENYCPVTILPFLFCGKPYFPPSSAALECNDAPSFGGRKENEENNGDSFITTLRTYGSKPTSFYSVYRRNFSNTTEEDQLVRAPDTQALTSPPYDVLL